MLEAGLLQVFVFLVAACLAVVISKRLKLGSVLGYLLAGVMIGSHGLGLITEAEQVMHMAEFGVIMMLFLIGLELNPTSLWRMKNAIFGMGSLQLIVTSLTLCFIGLALGYTWHATLAVGLILALSSTALVLQMLEEKNLMNSAIGERSFAILLFQDIAVIPILVFMPLLAPDQATLQTINTTWINTLPGILQAIIVASVIALMILSGRYGLPHLFRIIARTDVREIFTALALALIVGITLLMQQLGVSPALGAFIAGLVLANSEYRRTLETDIEPFKGLLLGLFFVSVGMGIDFTQLVDSPLLILGAVAAMMAIKAFILFAVGRIFNMSPLHNIGYALALSQGGEFAFVLLQYAGGLSILSSEQTSVLTLVVTLSIAITPLMMGLYSWFIVPKFMSRLPTKPFDVIEEKQPVIIAGFGRFGQVVGRFLMGQGVKVTVLEKDADQIGLLRKFGFKGYFGDASRLDLLKSAGAARAKLLVVAVDDADTCLDIVKMSRAEFPNLTVFARARNRQHAYDLHKLGVHSFKREMFEASLGMAKEIMVWLGYDPANMTDKAEKFRQHDEETLKESFAFFEETGTLIDYAKTRRAELEKILQDDRKTD